jgi:DNA-binding response OmpR family regulator
VASAAALQSVSSQVKYFIAEVFAGRDQLAATLYFSQVYASAQPSGMNPTQIQNLLLVDDDSELAAMLVAYLQRESFVVRVSATLADAAHEVGVARPDLILLDLMLPDGNGLTYCKQLRARDPALPILILTARGDPVDRVLGLELGADDYLAKPFEPRELVARVRALLRRVSVSMTPDAPRLMLGRLSLDLAQRRLFIDDADVRLTTIEFKLLLALARQPHQAVSRDALAAAAQPGNYRPQERAVDVQITRLRKKLREAAGGVDFIQTVRSEGYALVPDDA